MKNLLLSAILALSLVGVASAEVNLKSCTGCHGSDWSKKALGKSKVVSDMNVTSISTALIGYKEGTYGGPMKSLMKGQIIKYSDTEIMEVSRKIKGFELAENTDLNASEKVYSK